jgi:uncharacterized protein YxeA
MKKSLCIACLIFNLLIGTFTQAQNEITKDSISINARIADLIKDKDQNISDEKEALKYTIEAINKKLDDKEITLEKAAELKEAAAVRTALNIKYYEQYAALEEKYIRKNGKYSDEGGAMLAIGTKNFIRYRNSNKDREYQEYQNTHSGLTIGLAYNFMNGDNLDINDFSYPNNNYFSLGFQWKTRLDKNNLFRLTYGIEYQSHGTELNANRFITQGDQAQVAGLDVNAEKAKFRQDQLVFPLHIELGKSDRKEYEDGRVRFNEYDHWKFGIGGFVGFNMSSRLKLKYELDGREIKETRINNFDNEVLLYGLDAYIGRGNLTFFGRMNLNKVFKTNSVDAQYVAFGIRFQ